MHSVMYVYIFVFEFTEVRMCAYGDIAPGRASAGKAVPGKASTIKVEKYKATSQYFNAELYL